MTFTEVDTGGPTFKKAGFRRSRLNVLRFSGLAPVPRHGCRGVARPGREGSFSWWSFLKVGPPCNTSRYRGGSRHSRNRSGTSIAAVWPGRAETPNWIESTPQRLSFHMWETAAQFPATSGPVTPPDVVLQCGGTPVRWHRVGGWVGVGLRRHGATHRACNASHPRDISLSLAYAHVPVSLSCNSVARLAIASHHPPPEQGRCSLSSRLSTRYAHGRAR